MSARPVLAALALGGLASLGCASIAGTQEAEAKFLVEKGSDGKFFGWSEITTEQSASDASRATLERVTLSVDTSVTKDLTFIQDLTSEAVVPDKRTLVAKRARMDPGESLDDLDIVYTDDLRPFFPDGHTIRIEWKGETNPAFTNWPSGGIWVQVQVLVDIE